MIAPNVSYVPSSGIMCRELDGEMVLLDVESATYYSLNDTGTRVWRLLESRATIGQVCETIANEDEIPHEQMLSELVPFIEELLDTGLIRAAA
jgi:hypothetical protein